MEGIRRDKFNWSVIRRDACSGMLEGVGTKAEPSGDGCRYRGRIFVLAVRRRDRSRKFGSGHGRGPSHAPVAHT